MRRLAMARKFDWKRSAADYARLYRRVAAAA
jgi:glycogen synthase